MRAVKKLSAKNYSGICDYLAAEHPEFNVVKEQFGHPPFWTRPPGFATLVRIILEQQVSLASGKAHFEKLHAYSNGLAINVILGMQDAEFRACHISRQKTAYIRDLCLKLQDGSLNLDTMAQLENEAVAKQLCLVKGIGPWTASIYLMMCLHRPDHFPPGDIAAINAAKKLFPDMGALDSQQFLAATSRWAPFRTVATNYLWWWYLSSQNRPAVF